MDKIRFPDARSGNRKCKTQDLKLAGFFVLVAFAMWGGVTEAQIMRTTVV